MTLPLCRDVIGVAIVGGAMLAGGGLAMAVLLVARILFPPKVNANERRDC